MLIVSQNGAQVLVLENLGSIFSDANNKVRCANSQNGGGSELARYENREQTRYEMDALTIAYEMGEKVFRFSDTTQVRKNMAAAVQHRSEVSTRRNRHGGS